MTNLYISLNISHLRNKIKNLTQARLSKIIGVGVKTLNNYETGVSKPDFDKTLKLANFFKVSFEDFVFSDLSNPYNFSAAQQRARMQRVGLLEHKLDDAVKKSKPAGMAAEPEAVYSKENIFQLAEHLMGEFERRLRRIEEAVERMGE